MIDNTRRHDIDWLRVIAIGMLLIYHIGIAFQPWGIFIGFIQNEQSLEYLWPPMSMLNIWRIPLLFFVSGMGVSFAIARRSWKQLIIERSRRILLPFLFGIFSIVPLHLLLWQLYYKQDLSYTPHAGHLWFLGNIFIYVLLLSPLFFYLKKNSEGRLGRWIRRLFGHPPGLLFVTACFVLEAILVRPDSFVTYSQTIHGFFMGLLAFLFGFCFILAGDAFWTTVRTLRWPLFILALAMFLVRYLVFGLEAKNYYSAIESCLWIFVVFGFANKHLNRPGRALGYLSQAAYPVYILHMFFLYLGSSLIFGLEIPTLVKFILLNFFTLMGCFALYEFIIKRVRLLRPLFGLKYP